MQHADQVYAFNLISSHFVRALITLMTVLTFQDALDQQLNSEHFIVKERMPEVRHHFQVSWHSLCSALALWELLLQRCRGSIRWKSSSQLPLPHFLLQFLYIEWDLAEGSFGGSFLEQDLKK